MAGEAGTGAVQEGIEAGVEGGEAAAVVVAIVTEAGEEAGGEAQRLVAAGQGEGVHKGEGVVVAAEGEAGAGAVQLSVVHPSNNANRESLSLYTCEAR